MEAHLASKYQRARGENRPPAPTRAGLLALWLGQYYRQPLHTGLADGRAVTVLQPGVPGRPGSHRLIGAALRFDNGEIVTGEIGVGEAEPAALLRVTWKGGTGPHVSLRDQLLAPWDELADLVEPLPPAETREAASLREIPPLSTERLLDLLRSAGLYRLRRRARWIALRLGAVGRTQLLWELLAEALGYHRNQEPFRHLARRLPVSFLQPLDSHERMAVLFGVAGFLPEEIHRLPEASQAALRPLWERWWKARAALDYAVLPAAAWNRVQIRPANRPERRLAALALLLPHLERLERAVARRDAAAFARVCGETHDPFWSAHATWKSRPFPKPVQLIGEERVNDLILNLFWPLVSLDGPAAETAARVELEALPAAGNKAVRAAARRLLGGDAALGRRLRSALLQQGLLQIERDTGGSDTALQKLAAGWS